MALEYILYRSVARHPEVSAHDVDILRAMRCSNKTEGLTGLLYKENGWYFHFLEGDTQALSRTFSRIREDTRHFGIEVLEIGTITNRRFGFSRMDFCTKDHESLERFAGNLSMGRLQRPEIGKVMTFILARSDDTRSLAA